MSPQSPVELTAPERSRLAQVADALFPPSGAMPGASAVDTTGRWLDRVLAADPTLLQPLRALAARPEQQGWVAATAMFAEDPATFEMAADALVAAYYMHPGVRKRIGYPGQRGTGPILPDEYDYYLPDDLLAPVRARASSYVRPTDG